MLGRFPTAKEAENHDLLETVPVWLPTNDKIPNKKIMAALRSLTKWLNNDYMFMSNE